jgi:hypothetical protein
MGKSAANPHQLDADPDPPFHSDADADPDPALHQWYDSATTGIQTLHGSILNLYSFCDFDAPKSIADHTVRYLGSQGVSNPCLCTGDLVTSLLWQPSCWNKQSRAKSLETCTYLKYLHAKWKTKYQELTRKIIQCSSGSNASNGSFQEQQVWTGKNIEFFRIRNSRYRIEL